MKGFDSCPQNKEMSFLSSFNLTLPYFFGYKTGIFPAEMTPKNCTRLISKAVGSMPSFHQAQLIMDYML